MSVVIENGHGINRAEVTAEILEMKLFPIKWGASDIPKGLNAFLQDINLFVIDGELEIEVDGFPIFAHPGAHVQIPSKVVHELKADDNLQLYFASSTKEVIKPQRIGVINT
jgi:quercetin dioxygenase-like cupin family protein